MSTVHTCIRSYISIVIVPVDVLVLVDVDVLVLVDVDGLGLVDVDVLVLGDADGLGLGDVAVLAPARTSSVISYGSVNRWIDTYQ